MYAIEFLADIRKGVIKIPEEYRRRLQGQVRVILLSTESSKIEESPVSIIDVLAEAPGKRVFKSAAEVEQYLQTERQAWE
jgi:hypothetical protein